MSCPEVFPSGTVALNDAHGRSLPGGVYYLCATSSRGRALDVGEREGTPYVVMEYLDGHDLGVEVERRFEALPVRDRSGRVAPHVVFYFDEPAEIERGFVFPSQSSICVRTLLLQMPQ